MLLLLPALSDNYALSGHIRLRHYFVTSLLHCGVDKQTVADLVGHSDTGFLERTYCHPQQVQKEQAADSMLTMLRPDGEQIFNLAAACSSKQHSA